MKHIASSLSDNLRYIITYVAVSGTLAYTFFPLSIFKGRGTRK